MCMKRALIITAAVASLIPLVETAVGQSRQVVATTRSEWIKFNPVTPLTAATFANPPATDLPWVRLNMPPSADPAEIKVEVQQMRDAGIAGIEVGQGAFPNNEQLVALLTAANQGGIKVSLSHGPTQSPAGYSPDNDHARKTMYFGKAAVDAGATFDGALPAGTQTVVGRGGFGGAGGRGPAVPPPEQGREVRPPAALLHRQVPEAGPARVEAEEVPRQPGRRSLPCWPIAVSRRHAQRPGQQNSTAPR